MTPEQQAAVDAKVAAKVAAYEAKLQGMREASVEPLPGPMREAFGPDAVKSPVKLRPVVHYDMALLRALGSPLFKHLEAQALGQEAPKTDFSDEQGYEMLYLFSIPCAQAKAELEALGPDGFRARAFEAIGLGLNPAGFAAAIVELQERMIDAFSTAVRYEPEDSGGGRKVFTMPPTGVTTGSVGGSNTCAASAKCSAGPATS